MRFAAWVLKQIGDHGEMPFRDYSSFSGTWTYVNASRQFIWSHDESTDDNDWWVFISGWIFKDVLLQRGPGRENIKLTRAEKKVFLEYHKRHRASQKEKAREKKEAARLKNLHAQEF